MTEDKFAQLLVAVADQLRGQDDRTADAFVEYSARVRDPAARKGVARQVSNLYSGIGGVRSTVVRREGVVDAEATRALDRTLKQLYEIVTVELAPPVGEDRKVPDRKVVTSVREIAGGWLRTDFATALSVAWEPAADALDTMVMEFAVAMPQSGTPSQMARLTFVGVAEHTFSAEGFEHFGDDADPHRQRLIEVFDSASLQRLRSTRGRMEGVAFGLRHFRIGFAAHGDYDVLCRDLRIDRIPADTLDEQLEGLTPRANEFLRHYATRYVDYVDPAEERRDAMQAADQLRLPFRKVTTKLADLHQRFGGLRYQSHSWSLEGAIEFEPSLDLDDEDPEPMVSLFDHSTQPYGVWATLDGAVHFMRAGGEYVHVFDRIEAIIESDALMAECVEWIEVSRGGGDTIDLMETKVSVLSRIDEASGHTESWWLGDGFRVHVSRTMGRVFGLPGDGRWAVWAESEAAVERARAFLSA